MKSTSGSCVYKQAGYGSLTTKKPTTTTKKPTTTTKKPMPGWAKNAKKHCVNNKHSGSYTSLFKAQEACVKLGSKCSGVYDPSCDGKDIYYTCTTAKWATSSSSCIYSAPKATTTKKPTTKATIIKAIHCEFQYVSGSGAFKTYADAAKFCHEVGPTVCSGVYDFKCDGKDSFYACNTKAFQKSTKGSCVHKPEAWQKWSSQHCNGNNVGGAFKTLAEAQAYCQKVGPHKCTGVYDEKCDGKDSFYACDSKPYMKSTSGSCVYKQAGYGSLTTKKKPTTTTKKPMPGWAKNAKKHCFSSKHPTKYASLSKAQEACVKLGAKCSGVYDNGCDDKDEYYTCTTTKWAVSTSSCVYSPQGGRA